MSARRKRREDGTVAVVVALSSTMIFALCALGVDLGNGFARKRDIQTQADLAALAAAAYLPADLTNDANNADIYNAATQYATKNKVAGQTVTSWNFSDADKTNGYIEFVGANKLRLFAPKSRVNFALAPAAGLPDHMNVSAMAAAEIRSPGESMPFFVSQSCGWNDQTILDQTSGAPAPGYVPTLDPPSSPTAANAKIETINPPSAAKDATPPSMTLTSATPNGFDGVDGVWFTAEGAVPNHFQGTGLSSSGNSVTVTVPAAIMSEDRVWWVRVHKSNGKWSPEDNAKPFVVGSPNAGDSCDTKNSGNFGSLKLSRNDVAESFFLEENLALSVQHGLESYPPPYPADCSTTVPPAVLDSGAPVDGRLVNCLKTDSGADLQQRATRAFITGTTKGSPAKLAVDAPTNKTGEYSETPDFDYFTTCPNAPDDRLIDVSGPGADVPINNDLLSCFFENDTVTVGQVSSPASTPTTTHVISPAIFDSPRFFWVPVLVDDPSGGRSGSYAIVQFRPVFITGQADDAERDTDAAGLTDDGDDNGIEMASGNIEKIRVRAINPASLPEFTGDMVNTIDYVGVGTKIVRLVE